MTNQTAIKPVPLTPANMTPEAYAQKDYVAAQINAFKPDHQF